MGIMAYFAQVKSRQHQGCPDLVAQNTWAKKAKSGSFKFSVRGANAPTHEGILAKAAACVVWVNIGGTEKKKK